MTREQATTYCHRCGMETTRSPLFEPIMAATTLFDCRGVEYPKRIGFDAAACDVCGAVSIDDLAAGRTFSDIQAKYLNQTFGRHASDLGTAVQTELVKYCRRHAAVWLPLAMLGGTVVVAIYPSLAPVAGLPVFALATWVLRIGVLSDRHFERAVDRWIKQMPECEALRALKK